MKPVKHIAAILSALLISAAVFACTPTPTALQPNEQSHSSKEASSQASSESSPEETECTHAWTDATCVSPKTCQICGATEGSPIDDHVYKDGSCIYCGTFEPKTLEYIYAILAYYSLTDAHTECLEMLDTIYDAWHFAIYKADDYYSVQECFNAFVSSTGLDYDETLTALNKALGYQGYSDPTGAQQLEGLSSIDVTVDTVIIVYYATGKYETVENYLATAKEALRSVTNTYADYTGYNELKDYYSELSSCLEYCKGPTGSFNQFTSISESYNTNLRKLKNDLALYF